MSAIINMYCDLDVINVTTDGDIIWIKAHNTSSTFSISLDTKTIARIRAALNKAEEYINAQDC